MSTAILPLAVWASGTNQNSIPANDNALRMEAMNREIISQAVTAQPGSPSDGDTYIIAATHTGTQWATFSPGDIAIYRGGTWYAWAPVEGLIVNVAGSEYKYDGGAWTALGGGSAWGSLTGVPATVDDIGALVDPNADRLLFWDDSAGELTYLTLGTNLSITGTTINATGGGGSTQGKQAIPIMAAGIRPSVSGGCATLAAVASAANQPDIITLDFDATTEEYAQFAIPMPKKWDEGTITARFRWSHAATTTNFGVVWGIQAVAVSDDDTIAVAYGTAQTVTDTGGTTNDLYVTAETSAITVAGTPVAGDTVFFRVYRKAADGSDTMAIDARLHSVEIFITTDADTDA